MFALSLFAVVRVNAHHLSPYRASEALGFAPHELKVRAQS